MRCGHAVRLLVGGAQGPRGKVDACGVQAEPGAQEHVLAGPATGVQHPAPDGTRVGESEECRLRSADVPGRRLGVQIVGLRRLPGAGVEVVGVTE